MAEPVLVVDDDPAVLGMLTRAGRERGMDIVGVRTPAEAVGILAGRSFGVVVVDFRLGSESGLDVIRRLRAHDPSAESIIISSDDRLSSALETYANDVFAVVPKPVDPAQLFATVDRALERRRGTLERQRLTWELALLNEIAAIVASSLEIAVVMQRAAERIAAAFEAEFVFVRLRDDRGNPRVVATVGLNRQELERGLAEAKGVWPSDRALARGQIVRLDVTAGQPFTHTEIYRTYRWQSSLAVPIAVSEEVLGAITVASMTPARFAESDEQFLQTIGRQFAVAVTNAQLYERVHRAKVEWERTFDAISDPIAVFDGGGRTMRVNAALARLHGWKITETQGRTCAEVGLCGGGCPDCVVGVSSRENRPLEREIVTADGRIFAVTTLPITGGAASEPTRASPRERSGDSGVPASERVGGSAPRDEARGALSEAERARAKPPGSIVVQFAKEVTGERRRAVRLRELSQELQSANAELVSTLERLRSTQAQLVQSEKLSAIGLLVAGVAHELNNPLTSIIGYAQLVHEQLADWPDPAGTTQGVSEDIARILSESERAARIVRNLLTFARRQTSERVRQDIADLCRQVVQLRAYDLRLKGVEVVIQCAPDLPPVYADGGQIQQVLLNLLLNAEQALKDAKTRRIEILVTAEPECGAVLTKIHDTGHGIEEQNLRRVFDPFFTTRSVGEGTGLGLSIAYGIVRDHGGQIWAESNPEKRETSFFVRLPARYDSQKAEEVGDVLVAHADSVVREFLAAVFMAWGFSVRPAANLLEALESLAEDDIGLALVDRSVVEPDPSRWSTAWNRRHRPELTSKGAVMIATAATSTDDDTLRFLRQEARVVLAPPYDLYQLRRALLAATGAAS